MSLDEQKSGTGQAVSPERRVAERYPCDLQTLCREYGSGRGDWFALRVHNVSSTGIGLITPHQLRPGAILVLRLASSTRGMSHPVVVRVMHVTALEGGGWLTGAVFVRGLSLESLRELLREASPA
jgi:hypothetical protein